MEKVIITKKAVEDLVRWTVKECENVRLVSEKRPVSVSFVGSYQVEVKVDIEIKAGLNIVEKTEELRKQIKTTLEKHARLDLRYSKITVRGLYDE
ncbi:MAG: hypothetical protein ACK4HQ_08215 [Brevinematales bacterium]